jgi:hypothetical protein
VRKNLLQFRVIADAWSGQVGFLVENDSAHVGLSLGGRIAQTVLLEPWKGGEAVLGVTGKGEVVSGTRSVTVCA